MGTKKDTGIKIMLIDDEKKGNIIKKQYNDAILIGNHILNKYQWTTQNPYRLSIATNNINHNDNEFYNVFYRSKEWFQKIKHDIISQDYSSYNIISLTPSMCLADAILYNDSFNGLNPDDYEIPDEEKENFKKACKIFNISENTCEKWLNNSNLFCYK